MYIPVTPYAQVAFDSIAKQLGTILLNYREYNIPIPNEFYTLRRGCFVSLHKSNGELRGCIGTIYPQEKHLYDEISRNAVSAAFNDSRFSPLELSEFPDIEISVDVLTPPELIYSPDDLDPMIFGIMISDGRNHRSVLLPGIEEIDTLEKQLKIAKRKAGISDETTWEELQVMRFTSNRYH